MMKIKIFSSFLIALISIFTALMFIKKEEGTTVVSVDKIYSLVRSNVHEEFTFPLLISEDNSTYANLDFINNLSISDENLTISIPFEITEIRKDDLSIIYNDQIFYQYYFDGIINIESSDYTLKIEEGYLNIDYKNMKSLTISVGEININFTNQVNNDLSLSKLEAVFCEIESINTVCGVKIELFNKSNQNIFISSINIDSTSAIIPNYYLREINYNYETIDDLTNSEQYNNLLEVVNYEQTILIGSKTAKYLFFPINYTGNIKYINQFGMSINYNKNGILNKYIVDDFLFMSSSPFREELEGYYTVYEIKD